MLVQVDGRAAAVELHASRAARVARERPRAPQPQNHVSSGCRSCIHLGFPVLESLPARSARPGEEMGAEKLCNHQGARAVEATLPEIMHRHSLGEQPVLVISFQQKCWARLGTQILALMLSTR